MVAKSLKHAFVSGVADGADTTLVRPSNWNADHNFFLGYRTVTITTDTIADTDNFSLITYNQAGAVAVTIAQAGAASQFLSGWTCFIRNRGAGAVTITPTTSTINEAATLVLQQNDYAQIFSDGTNYQAFRNRDPTKVPLDGTIAMTGRLVLPSASLPRVDKGTVSSGTVTFDVSAATRQRLQVGGALTVAYSNWPASGNYGEIMIQLVNGGAFTVTWPTTNWMVGDGTSSTTFSAMGVTLATSGTNWVTVWTLDGGTTLYGRAM